MDNYTYTKELPVRYDVDVCVVGGGPAGVAAGVTAARAGAKVIILESQGFFGGGGTAALVPAFMPFSNGVDFMAGGIGYEVFLRTCTPELALSIRPEVLKRTYDEMVAESGADFLFFATVTDVITRDGGIDAVIVAAKSGLYAIKAKIFVDATGDGDICAWGGAPYELGDATGHVMPSTLCSMWADIDWNTVPRPNRNEKFEIIDKAINDGIFTQSDYHVSGIWQTGEHTGGGNIGHCYHVNATDERSLTEAMVLGRKILPEFERFYREYMGGGYSNASLVSSASYLGIRESRRIMGDYVLNINDYRADSYFDDEIGRFNYPIDIHPEPGKENYQKFLREHTTIYLDRGESFSIPYRCLCPRNLSNVLVAGRCVSTDQKIQSSIRVMPGCYITGMAAGMAAAIAAEGSQDIRKVNISTLQSRLAAAGAWLPNHK